MRRRHATALTCVLTLSALSALGEPSARADSDWGFGVVPEVKLGPNFGAVPGGTAAKPESTGSNGWLLEGTVSGLFAGPKVGFGASFGYVIQGMATPDGYGTSIGMGYDGWTLTPMVMLALDPRVILVAKGGFVFGTIANGQADDLDALGWRLGGQLMFVPFRNAGADVTVGIEFLHTQSTGTYPDGTSVTYAGNAIVLASTFSFFSGLLDL